VALFEEDTGMMKRGLLLVALVAVCGGCSFGQGDGEPGSGRDPGTNKQAAKSREASKEPEGYRVISYDSRTGKWVIIRNGTYEGRYLVMRITAVCSSYQWGKREPVYGPQACDLSVGQFLASNTNPTIPQDFVYIFETGSERLNIIRGEGDDRVMQLLEILKCELLE
jgi:hypothetical protein